MRPRCSWHASFRSVRSVSVVSTSRILSAPISAATPASSAVMQNSVWNTTSTSSDLLTVLCHVSYLFVSKQYRIKEGTEQWIVFLTDAISQFLSSSGRLLFLRNGDHGGIVRSGSDCQIEHSRPVLEYADHICNVNATIHANASSLPPSI